LHEIHHWLDIVDSADYSQYALTFHIKTLSLHSGSSSCIHTLLPLQCMKTWDLNRKINLILMRTWI